MTRSEDVIQYKELIDMTVDSSGVEDEELEVLVEEVKTRMEKISAILEEHGE